MTQDEAIKVLVRTIGDRPLYGLRDKRKVRIFVAPEDGKIDEITRLIGTATGARFSRDNNWLVVRGSGHCPVGHIVDLWDQASRGHFGAFGSTKRFTL